MANDLRPRPRVDRDGVRRVDTRLARVLRWLLGATLVCLAVAAWLVARWTREDAAHPMVVAKAVVAEPRPAPPAVPPPPPAHEKPAPPGDEILGAGTPAPPDEAPKDAKEEPTFTPLKPGEKAGLAVFPPPGTKPLKRGIIVPDDFELPPGYVRHYQTTDDGRRLPPILMFHPDYAGTDANGNPIPVPEDRIVTPDMAPPGLPIRMLDDPEHDPGTAMGRARTSNGGGGR